VPLDDLPNETLRDALAWLRAMPRTTTVLSWPATAATRGLRRAGLLRGQVVGGRIIGRLERGRHHGGQ